MAESVTIRLVGEDAGAKALIAAVREQIDKLTVSGKAQASAAGSAATGLKNLQLALRAIAAATIVRGFVELAKSAIDLGDQLNKLSEQTGVSVEKLSVLKFAADQNETSLEALLPVFRGLSNSLRELASGSGEAVQAFRSLNLSAADFKGLTLDQSLKLVADRLDQFADGPGKIAAANKILGRSAIELLPLLKAISGEGLANLTAEAERAGLVMSTDAAKGADEFKDKLSKLRASMLALVSDAITPSLPQLTAFVEKLTEGGGAARQFGDFLTRLAEAIPFGIGEAIKFQDQLNAALRVQAALNKPPPSSFFAQPGPPKPEVPVVDEAAARARIARSVALLQQEAALIAAKNKIVEQDNKAAFEKGLTALDDYYENRRTILNRETNAEVEILKRQRAVVQSIKPATPADQIAQAQAADAINAQIALKQQARGLENAQLDLEQFQAKKKLSEDIIGFEATILAARGQTVEATKLQIDEEIRKDRELLLQRRALTAEDERQLETKRALLTQRAQFDNLSAQSDRVFADVANQRAAIELQASQGLISQREAEHQIALLEQSRIPVLKQLAADMLAFAESTKDPALIAAAQNLAAQIGGLGIERSLNQARVAMANFKDDAIDALGSSLANFLGSGINQVHSLGDAFRSLALSAVESLQRIIGQILALQAVEAIRRALGRGEEAVGAAASATAISSAGAAAGTAIATGSAAAATTLTTAGTAAGAAIGIGAGRAATALGFSAGALSTSGAVLSAAAKELLAAATALAAAGTGGGGSNLLTGLLGLAGGGAPGGGPSISFASPGVPSLGPMPLVGSLSLSDLSVSPLSLRDFSSLQAPTFTAADREIGAGPGGFGGEVSVTIGLEEGLVAREMKKPAGVKATVHNIGNNPKAINSVLGRR